MYTYGPLIAKNARSGRLLGGAPVQVTALDGTPLTTAPAGLVTNHEGYLPAFTVDTDQVTVMARPRGGDPLPLHAHEGIQGAAQVADTINNGRLSEASLSSTFASLDGDRLTIDDTPLGPDAVGAQPAGEYQAPLDTGATGLALLAAALPADAREALDITIDTSVGTRVLVGDVMVYGDTGWRAIATWDDAGTITGDIGTGLEPVEGQSGGVYWRRSGERVALRIVAARAAANVQYFAIPAGFRPSGVPYPTGSIATETVAASYFQAGAGTVYLWVPSGTAIPRGDSPSYGAEVSWETARSWPTTLPGTPA